MKKQKKEITQEKINYSIKKINKYIKNIFAERDLKEFDGVNDDNTMKFKLVRRKVYIGFKCLDKVDTRLSNKRYPKTKYIVNEYKAVTPRYIQQFVCKEKVSLRLINYVLIVLALNKKITIMKCSDIGKIVIHRNPNWGGSTGYSTLRNVKYNTPLLIPVIQDYQFVKNYLKSNKIENSNSRLVISV